MRQIQTYKLPCLLAILQWLLTTILQVDRLFFTYDYIGTGLTTYYFITVKVLYFFTLLLAWCFGFHVYQKIKAKDEIYKRGLFIFCVYLTVMTVFLMLLWPGTWSLDDVAVLKSVSHYDIYWWQHCLTSLYQLILLQIIPIPGGLIFLQNVVISLCVAFCVTKLEILFGIRRLSSKVMDTFVKIVPFLLPPLLAYQFAGYRMGLYVYLELTMLVMLISMLKTPKLQNKKMNLGYMLFFCVLCIVVATWRTESFCYMFCVCALIPFVKKDLLSSMQKGVCIILIITGFLGLTGLQEQMTGLDYHVISLMGPCVELVRAADPIEDTAELKEIDRVASLDVIAANPDRNGEQIFWYTDVIREGYSKSDYGAFRNAIVKLSIKHPKVVFQERWNLFLDASGVTDNTYVSLSRSPELFDQSGTGWGVQIVREENWFANKPISVNLRKAFIDVLYVKSKAIPFRDVLRRVVYNIIPPLIALIGAWIILLFKKKWKLWIICTAVAVKIPLVFLTQGAAWFMYWLSFYLLGYVLLLYTALWLWSKKKNLKESVSVDG